MTTPDRPEIPSTLTLRRRRGWLWKIPVILVLLLILLVLLGPTLASTSVGKGFVLGQVNKNLGGKTIEADSLSLGWFSGTKLQRIKYIDATGRTVVIADAINTSITVWDALTGKSIDLKDVQIVNATMPERPNVVIAVKLVGVADLGRKVLNFTGPSEITATDNKSQNVSKLEIPAGSVVSWGDIANDVNAVITYHLSDIQPLIAERLPKDAVLEGSFTMPFHIVGALTKDPGLQSLRGFTIHETRLGEGRIYMEGFDLGKAEIPYKMENGVLTISPTDVPFKEGGRIRVRGRVDFNSNPPFFIIDTPDDPREPFIKDMQLNHKIAEGKLRFFPLFWGATPGHPGEVRGKVNLRLDYVKVPLDPAAFNAQASVKGVVAIHELETDAPFFKQINDVMGDVGRALNLKMLNIRGGKIDDVSFQLTNGKVEYQNLRLGASMANITFSGAVGLDNSLAMDMTVGLPGVNFPIPVSLKGTIAKPELTPGKMPDIKDLKNIGKGLENLGKDVGKDLEKAPDMLKDIFDKKKNK